MRNIGVIAIIIVLALASMAPGHGGGGGGGGGGSEAVYVETSESFGETIIETSESSGESSVTSESFAETFVTGDAFNESSGTSDAFGVTVYTASPEAAAAAQDFLAGLDFSVLNPDADIPDGLAQAFKDSSPQDWDPDASDYALKNYQALDGNPDDVIAHMLNISADGLTADTLRDVWRIPSFEDFKTMSVDQAQTTLAEITLNFTFEIQAADKKDFLGLMENIAINGDLVQAEVANKFADIFDSATMADLPLSQEGLSNWLASVTGDISDAVKDSVMEITANYGVGKGEFIEFALNATFFDTVDLSDIPKIDVNALAAKAYG